MEMPDEQITQSVSVRAQPPKPDVVGKLRIACMEVLVAALNWQAFRETDNMEVVPRGREESSFKLSVLRDRIMRSSSASLDLPMTVSWLCQPKVSRWH